MDIFQLPSPLQQLQSNVLNKKNIEVWVKRDDLIHSEISGNKWRKLKYNLKEASDLGMKRVLTFGGAYSNHIAATAAAGKELGFETIGIIRGDEGFDNKTLDKARENGMHLHFISREAYKKKTEDSFINELRRKIGNFYMIPEGGANALGVKGCEEILAEIDINFDYVLVSAGTGTTASGISRSLKRGKLIVFPALKGGGFILDEIKKYDSAENTLLQLAYHFGGYARTKPELLKFMRVFKEKHDIELDKVYTSKLFFGFFDLLEKDFFPSYSKVLLIHTGGVQGN